MIIFKSKKKKRLEEEAAIKAFLNDYKELVIKHGIDFNLYLDITNKGIHPVARPVKVQYAEQPKTDNK